MLGYTSSITLLLVRPGSSRSRAAFLFHSIGAIAFFAHVFFAFRHFYGWSHSIAWQETRRQTIETTGFDSGHGIFLNYALGILWAADLLRWGITKVPLHKHNFLLAACFHGFFLFMIINGGIVFASGPVRYFTILLVLCVSCAGLHRYFRDPRATG